MRLCGQGRENAVLESSGAEGGLGGQSRRGIGKGQTIRAGAFRVWQLILAVRLRMMQVRKSVRHPAQLREQQAADQQEMAKPHTLHGSVRMP